jgi:hypothetical protein
MVTPAYQNTQFYNPEDRNAKCYRPESPKSNTGALISGFIKGICHGRKESDFSSVSVRSALIHEFCLQSRLVRLPDTLQVTRACAVC